MTFKLLANVPLPLEHSTQWILDWRGARRFITGDTKKAFAIDPANPSTPAALPGSNRTADSACNLPIASATCDEVLAGSWRGFSFLKCAEYAHNTGGDLLRTIIFGPNYGLHMRHPASGLVLALKSASIDLLTETNGAFAQCDKTKTRGKAALCFAAHPNETLLAYGDNYGAFHLHLFDATGFAKASKLAEKEGKASAVEFAQHGERIIIGGMGYLSAFSYCDGKTRMLHETSTSVRDFVLIGDGERIVVNQGLHGIALYSFRDHGFEKLSDATPAGPVNQIAMSDDGKLVAITRQDRSDVSVFAVG